jgi:hypothetical protein
MFDLLVRNFGFCAALKNGIPQFAQVVRFFFAKKLRNVYVTAP